MSEGASETVFQVSFPPIFLSMLCLVLSCLALSCLVFSRLAASLVLSCMVFFREIFIVTYHIFAALLVVLGHFVLSCFVSSRLVWSFHVFPPLTLRWQHVSSITIQRLSGMRCVLSYSVLFYVVFSRLLACFLCPRLSCLCLFSCLALCICLFPLNPSLYSIVRQTPPLLFHFIF